MSKRPIANQAPDDTLAIAVSIGRRIKALRTERGWSLDALASRSKVSKGVLVNLEQERPNSNPNLTTLVRLTEAFGLPLTHLIEADPPSDVRILGPERRVVMWNGPSGGTGELVVASDPPNIVEIWQWEMFPGESFGGEAHSEGTTELIVVETGELTFTVGGEPHFVSAGSTVVFTATHDHVYANTSKKRLSFWISVYMP